MRMICGPLMFPCVVCWIIAKLTCIFKYKSPSLWTAVHISEWRAESCRGTLLHVWILVLTPLSKNTWFLTKFTWVKVYNPNFYAIFLQVVPSMNYVYPWLFMPVSPFVVWCWSISPYALTTHWLNCSDEMVFIHDIWAPAFQDSLVWNSPISS